MYFVIVENSVYLENPRPIQFCVSHLDTPSIISPKMSAPTFILLATTGFIIFAGVIWRLASRRQSLPCPTWLRWLVELDNPFTKTNCAAFIVEHLNLQPGSMLSVTEVIFDPRFQTRSTVTELAETAGFKELAFFGNRIAYVLNFEKPIDG